MRKTMEMPGHKGCADTRLVLHKRLGHATIKRENIVCSGTGKEIALWNILLQKFR